MAAAPPVPPSAVRPAGPPTWLAAAAIVLGGFAAYHNTLGVPFLFDDEPSIRGNPTLDSLLAAWWPPPGGGLTVSGRPFLNFTFAVNHALSGHAVWSYHVGNLLIHVAAGCTLFAVVRRALGQVRRFAAPDAGWIALVVALLWTLHPLQTQAVTYIAQRAESLVSLLYLLTLWGFTRAVAPGASWRWTVLTWVACLLGMATKEVMVTAPVMVALYDRVFLATSWREVWRQRGRRHLALAATWLPLAALVLAAGDRGGTAGIGAGVSPVDYALTQLTAVTHYLRLAFWPQPLVFDYGTALVAGGREVWGQALVLGPLVAASLWAAWRGRPAGYAAVFVFAVLAPSSSVVPVVSQTMSEHRMYLPLAGLVTLAVAAVHVVAGRRGLVAVALLIPVLGIATVRRNHDYRSALDLWQDTVAKRPANARALNAVGVVHLQAGRMTEAEAVLRRAVQADPTDVGAHNNLGNVLMNTGRPVEALACFERAVALQPELAGARAILGGALLQAGRVAEALPHLEAAVRLDPSFPDARYHLALGLAQAGRLPEAAEHFAAVVRSAPEDLQARAHYGGILLQLDRLAEAIVQFEAAVRLRPDDAGLHNDLGVALARAGRPKDALAQFREALRLQPDFTNARENAAEAEDELRGGQ